MTDATHRIEVSHDPHSQLLPWDARVTRLSDEQLVTLVSGSTEDEALANAQAWVRAESQRAHVSLSVLVDDDGQVVPSSVAV